jgi:hypothetical protein
VHDAGMQLVGDGHAVHRHADSMHLADDAERMLRAVRLLLAVHLVGLLGHDHAVCGAVDADDLQGAAGLHLAVSGV